MPLKLCETGGGGGGLAQVRLVEQHLGRWLEGVQGVVKTKPIALVLYENWSSVYRAGEVGLT